MRWVSAVCLAAGVLVLPALYLLWENALNLGIVGGLMVGNDRSDVFFGLLLVHGLLELTCIFVAAGVGICGSVGPGSPPGRCAPGARPSRPPAGPASRWPSAWSRCCWSVGSSRRFVTPSVLPPAVKLAIGTFVWLAFLGYAIGFGVRAARAGESADVDEPDREAFAPAV